MLEFKRPFHKLFLVSAAKVENSSRSFHREVNLEFILLEDNLNTYLLEIDDTFG